MTAHGSPGPTSPRPEAECEACEAEPWGAKAKREGDHAKSQQRKARLPLITSRRTSAPHGQQPILIISDSLLSLSGRLIWFGVVWFGVVWFGLAWCIGRSGSGLHERREKQPVASVSASGVLGAFPHTAGSFRVEA